MSSCGTIHSIGQVSFYRYKLKLAYSLKNKSLYLFQDSWIFLNPTVYLKYSYRLEEYLFNHMLVIFANKVSAKLTVQYQKTFPVFKLILIYL